MREHILNAYFSWADNTAVEDEEAAVQSALAHYESIGDGENYSHVDAVASDSVVAPGIDFLMTALLLLLMAYQVTGEALHEYIGAGMLILFLLHNSGFFGCWRRESPYMARFVFIRQILSPICF